LFLRPQNWCTLTPYKHTLHKVGEKLCDENTIFLEHTHPHILGYKTNLQIQGATSCNHSTAKLSDQGNLYVNPVNITKNIMAATGSFLAAQKSSNSLSLGTIWGNCG
jgi:hypothetical protein